MADRFEIQSSLFPEDSPASRTATPGTVEAQMMTAHSGRNLIASYARFSRLPSFSKMLLASSIWNSTKCFLIWKPQVTPRRRLIFRLRESTPTTFAIESGLLPTPTATEYGSGQNGKPGDGRKEYAGKGMPSLSTLARRMIPTPTAGDAKSAGSRNTPDSKANPGLSLTDYVREDGGRGRESGLWATPSARDWKDTPGMSSSGINPDGSERKRSDQLARQVYQHGQQRSGQLNPEWVEWLMGYPVGWTESED